MRKLELDRTNGFAENGRLKKATKLSDCIAEFYGPVTEALLETVFVQSNEWWVSLAKSAKVNPPSPASVQATIGLLAQNHLELRRQA